MTTHRLFDWVWIRNYAFFIGISVVIASATVVGLSECKRRLTLKEIKRDQGIFENAVSITDGEIWEGYEACRKSINHFKFKPITKFSKYHLSPAFQDQLVVDTVKTLGDLTVKIRVGHISQNRPDKFSFRDMNYPFSNCRGMSYFRRDGSGFIVQVKKKVVESDGKMCKCILCHKLPPEERSAVYGEIMVWSAKHLVFDQDELANSKVQLFFDTPNSYLQERTQVREGDNGNLTENGSSLGKGGDDKVELYPRKMWYSEIEGDWCGFYCVTHDLELWEGLREMYKHSEKLQKEMDAKYRDNNDKLAIMVSHPHGLSKHVSFGEWTSRSDIEYKGDVVQTYYNCTIPTCEGCSGAPTWINGRKARGMFVSHPHSCDEGGSSRSAVGFNW